MTDDKYLPPDQDKGDAAYAVGRALLSAIPVAGGAAVELFQFIIAPPIEKRRNRWMKEIGHAVQNLEQNKGIDIEQLKSNDVFVDTLLQASQIALRNSQQFKLNALRNAVINSALPQPIEQTLQQMFLNWIDIFTILHIRILSFFHSPEQWAKNNKMRLPSSVSVNRPGTRMEISNKILRKAFPDLEQNRELYDEIFKDLDQKGLIRTGGLLFMINWSDGVGTRTTDLGEQFLAFISEKK